ncbi:preprotein translocase subunit YajC [candidate division KSB1 bacterium]|nr:MAG: preprotein translocase subunit YajC [candidate division KSB1 bacterium]MBC6951906.1 preprotein translocase subunit YajC [candidate division KSB1 bacterium]MCE7942840.1 preprotein translocase subunit YajC [Chlorobi bacterium CHB1]MDL1875989.1 preprotein translocase subunit YajC [Cytophagia bacterium CHB2]
MVPLVLLLQTTAPAGSRNPMLDMGLMFGLMLLVMYFLMIRPQMKLKKQHQQMLNSLQKGDQVLTNSGIYGKIVGIKEKEQVIVLQIAKNVDIEIARGHIGRKIEKTEKTES